MLRAVLSASLPMLLGAALPAVAAARGRVRPVVVVVDVGAREASPEVRAAVEAAVAAASKMQPHPDPLVRAALRGEEAKGAPATLPSSLPAAEAASAEAGDHLAIVRAAVRELRRGARDGRPAAITYLGREVGAARVLAFEVYRDRVRAQLYGVASGAPRGGLYDAEARKLTQRPADLAAFLDGAAFAEDAVAAGGPEGKAGKAGKGEPARGRTRWWQWAVGAAAAVALGVLIYRGEQSSDQVTIRVVKP
jgi:hypothetical protein